MEICNIHTDFYFHIEFDFDSNNNLHIGFDFVLEFEFDKNNNKFQDADQKFCVQILYLILY
jgi:hypothetical protein